MANNKKTNKRKSNGKAKKVAKGKVRSRDWERENGYFRRVRFNQYIKLGIRK